VWHELQAKVLDSTAENAGLLAAFGIGNQSTAEDSYGKDADDFYSDEFTSDFYS
jgi:hypothetical protein